MKTDMRKLRPGYGSTRNRPGGVYMIAETVHVRDADRVLAEPWPFTWTPPGKPDVPPWWWPADEREQWKIYHRLSVIGA